MGADRRGELDFYQARDGFIALHALSELAMISLDIGELYLLEGRYAELKKLARETYTLCQQLGVDRDALAALALWIRAIKDEQVTLELSSRIRTTIASRVAPSGMPE